MRANNYRVFLLLHSADLAGGCAQLRARIGKTLEKSDLFLVAGAELFERLAAEDPELFAACQSFEVDRATSRAAALSQILREFGDRDFAFAGAGIELPEMWDLRLAWTARRFPGVATVSPVFASELGAAHSATLDRLCYRLSHFALIESETLQDFCIYVRSAALEAVAPFAADAKPSRQLRRLASEWKRMRYSQVIADHVCAGGVSEKLNRTRGEASAILEALGRGVGGAADQARLQPPVAEFMRSRVLHLAHSWGGGLERWVREYCHADCFHDNLVLRPCGHWGAFGSRLALYRHVDDDTPIREWPLSPSIKSTDPDHAGYRAALARLIEDYGIEAIVVSSLIGHSLDALRTGLPTVLVGHDYYPFCPALNITFEGVCQSCDDRRLSACTAANPHHRFFRNTPAEQWRELRQEFARELQRSRPVLAAPSASVRDAYQLLSPEIAAQCRVIPHGARRLPGTPLSLHPAPGERLRLLVLGSLAPNKGLAILESIAKDLLEFADLFLVGCGDFGRNFAELPAVTVIPEYRWEKLAAILGEIAPDLAFLPAVVPETFSFTLQELFELAIPTLASDLGSFHDRIEDGVTGFLSEPQPLAMLNRLRELAADRAALHGVHERLRATPVRGMEEMLADYRELLRAPEISAKAYFSRDSRPPSPPIALACCELRWNGGTARSALFRPALDRRTIELTWREQANPPAPLDLHLLGMAGTLRVFNARLFDHAGEPVWQASELPHTDGVLSLPIPEQHAIRLARGGRLQFDLELPPAGASPRSSEAAERNAAVSREQLALELEHARLRIAEIEQSLSWKISQPLRTLGAAYLKAKDSFQKD